MGAAITRREFLRHSLVGGVAVAVVSSPLGHRLVAAVAVGAENFRPNAWVHIAPDGWVTIAVSKCEMGQGVYTALPMIVADELGADWARVRIEEVPVGEAYIDPVWGMQGTGGSTSVRHMMEPLRKAGAAAREMLVAAAAGKWGVPTAECEAGEGEVRHPASGRAAEFGSLAAAAARLPVPEDPTLRKGAGPLVGRSLERLDLPEKVNGTARFGIDSFVDGMLYGAVARSPAFGSRVKSFKGEAASKVPGVKHVLEVGNGVAVCAETLDAAWTGREALAVQWEAGARPDLDAFGAEKVLLQALEGPGVDAGGHGDAAAALEKAAKVVEATYVLPYLAHITMEPMNCTVHVRDDGCDVWVPSQNQTGTLQLAAKVAGLDPSRVRVHTTYLGCGFGRRFETDFVADALELSKKTGRPVKVVWTREEDVQHDFYRPANACRIRGGLDEEGKLVAWSHRIVAPSIWARVSPGMMKDGVDPAAVEGVHDTPYQIPNLRVEYVEPDLPIPVGFWRSVGHSHNGFTVESFVDELAHAAGADPLAYRLALLPQGSPSRRVLETVAAKAGWGKAPKRGQALGLAQHYSFGSAVAQVAEVSVDEKSGMITVHRVTCAVDPGRVVNPDTVVAQMMGAVVMGLSAGLKERVSLARGGVSSENYYDYEILRMDETPEIAVHVVEGGGALGGVGEPGLPPTAPAVANALFAATGTRIRRLPMTPKAVQEAGKG